MDWFVVRHPDLGVVACVAESALDVLAHAGWVRITGPLTEDQRAQFHPGAPEWQDLTEPADEAGFSFAPADPAESEE